MPKISSFNGMEIYMYYRDHSPPHFHAKHDGNQEFTIDIKAEKILDGDPPPSKNKKALHWNELRKDILLKNWNKCQNGERPDKVDPLLHEIHIIHEIMTNTDFRRIKSAQLNNDVLTVTFYPQDIVKLNISGMLQIGGVFSILNTNADKFIISSDERFIFWPNGLDICGDYIWREGEHKETR